MPRKRGSRSQEESETQESNAETTQDSSTATQESEEVESPAKKVKLELKIDPITPPAFDAFVFILFCFEKC